MRKYDKKVFTNCDSCGKKMELFETHYIYGYYADDLKIYEEYACCSIKCLKKMEK